MGGERAREGEGEGGVPEPNRGTKANYTELPISSTANNLRDRRPRTEYRGPRTECRCQCGWLSDHTSQGAGAPKGDVDRRSGGSSVLGATRIHLRKGRGRISKILSPKPQSRPTSIPHKCAVWWLWPQRQIRSQVGLVVRSEDLPESSPEVSTESVGRGQRRCVVSGFPPLVDRSPGAPWHQPGPHSGVPKNLHTREVTCEDGRSVCTKPLPCSETTRQRMESVVATTICFFRRGT